MAAPALSPLPAQYLREAFQDLRPDLDGPAIDLLVERAVKIALAFAVESLPPDVWIS